MFKTKRLISLVLAGIFTIAVPLTSFAATDAVKAKEKDKDPVVTKFEVVFPADTDKKSNKDVNATAVWPNEVPVLMTTYTQVDPDYIGVDNVEATGFTDVTTAIPGVDVWAHIRNTVLFYKNARIFLQPTENAYGMDPTCTTTATDWSPKSGDAYTASTQHLVWDNTGYKQLDYTDSDSTTY